MSSQLISNGNYRRCTKPGHHCYVSNALSHQMVITICACLNRPCYLFIMRDIHCINVYITRVEYISTLASVRTNEQFDLCGYQEHASRQGYQPTYCLYCQFSYNQFNVECNFSFTKSVFVFSDNTLSLSQHHELPTHCR